MGETRREGERKRTLAVGADEPEQHRASRPPLLPGIPGTKPPNRRAARGAHLGWPRGAGPRGPASRPDALGTSVAGLAVLGFVVSASASW